MNFHSQLERSTWQAKPAIAGLVTVLSFSCTPAHKGIRIDSMAELAPETVPGTSAELMLAGTSYSVQISVKRNEDRMELILLSHGEPFEIERYQVSADRFSLLDAAEEHFVPALPLLKFPLRIGDGWSWAGTMKTGDISRQASAKIVSAWETLFVSGVSHDSVKITVDLAFDANKGKPPLKRQLVFWFEPKAGLIKREFGTASIRQPSQG